MKRKSLFFTITFMLMFVTAAVLVGQDNASSPDLPTTATEDVSVKEPPAVPAAEKKQTNTNTKKNNERNKATNEPVVERDSSVSTGLLPITEGNFKYSRIPGIVLSQPKALTTDDIVRVPSTTSPSTNLTGENGSDSAGLFGMSKETADTTIKIFIGLLLVAIVILYRNRSRRSHHKVFTVHSRK